MKGYRTKRLMPKRACASGSFRTKKLSARTRLIVCCPRGKWSARSKRCRVGMTGYEILKRK